MELGVVGDRIQIVYSKLRRKTENVEKKLALGLFAYLPDFKATVFGLHWFIVSLYTRLHSHHVVAYSCDFHLYRGRA